MKLIAAAALLCALGAAGAAAECLHGQLIPNPSNCASFFQCAHGELEQHACPEGLTFHHEQGLCSYPARGDSCTPWRRSLDERARRVRAARAVPECPVVQGSNAVHLPDPDDCTSFYVCEADGHPQHTECPPGLAFNTKLSVCDWPENVPGCDV